MTKKQCMTGIRKLLKDANIKILVEAMHLLDSGGVDYKEAGVDYLLPKSILAICFERAATNYRPMIEKDFYNNLKHY